MPEREKSGFLAEMSENQSKIRKTVPKAQNQENQENQSTSDPCNNITCAFLMIALQ